MEDLIEERHRDADAVGLGCPDQKAPSGLRFLEGVANDPLHAPAGEDAFLDGYLVWRIPVHAPTRVRVLALRVLPDDGDVEIVRLCERALHTPQESCRAQVYVLVEGAPYGEEKAPEGDVIRHRRPAHRAEVDRIVTCQGFEALFWHHAPMLQVILAAPRELRKTQFQRGVFPRHCLEHPHARAHDLWTYTVAPDNPDLDHDSMLATRSTCHQAHGAVRI